jgi:hypothetical protein
VIHVYDEAGNVIETHEHADEFKEWRAIVRYFADVLYHLSVLRDSVILTLRLKQESVAGHQYARPHIGASITRANSENGARCSPAN